jgi:hypothetical protein
LAGGLNLYGYAGGDPVNFSDPFGLCPHFLTGRPCSVAASVAISLVPVIGDILDVASAVAGRDVLTGEGLSGAAIGVTLAGTVFGSGKAAREGVAAAARFSEGTAALVEMAKGDKRTGVTLADMDAYSELNKMLPDPFPSSKVRVDAGHPGRSPSSQKPHGHVGPVDHIPIKDIEP